MLFWLTCPGQEPYADSLFQKLKSSNGRERIQTLYHLGSYHIGKDSSKAINFIEKGIELSERDNDKEEAVRGRLEMARLYNRYYQPHLAIENILQLSHLYAPISFRDSIEVNDILSIAVNQLGALQMAIDYRKAHSRLLARINKLSDYYYSSENIAYLYSRTQQYDSAGYYYDQAYDIAQSMNNISLLMHCNNNMGFNYYVQERYDPALEKFEAATTLFGKKEAPTLHDSLLYGIIIGNIGNVYAAQNAYHQAAEHYEHATTLLHQLNQKGIADSTHYGNYLIEYAAVEHKRQNYASAEDKLKKAYVNIRHEPAQLTYYYDILSKVFEATGRIRQANEALKKQQEVNRRIIELRTHVNSNVHDLVKFQENRIRQETRLLSMLVESEKEVSSLKIQLIVGFSSLVFIILLILFFRYRSEQRKKEKLFEIETNLAKLKLRNKSLESNKLREVLDYKHKDLASFAIDITRKHDFIKELLSRLNQLNHSGNPQEDLKEIIFYTKSQLQIDNNLKLFQENVNKVNHEFMAKLHQRFPDLTTNEQQICALLRLQLSTKEIATVKNISPDSVKVLRHRLRKKMKLSPQVSLNKFLDELI